jgi:beta-phosphoglucomutase
MSSFPVFLFDMDGVIIDSTETHTRAWQLYLDRHGIEQPYIAERMLGKHNDEIVREFFAAHDMDMEAILRHGANKEALYRELMQPSVDSRLVPGVRAFIEKHAGKPMGVASNAEPANVDFVLDLAGLREFFGAVASGHDVARPKPAPDIYLHAARKLRADPADCVVFEDSATGVAAARAAGMRVVGVLTSLSRFDNVDLAVHNFLDPRLETWLSSLPLPVRS